MELEEREQVANGEIRSDATSPEDEAEEENLMSTQNDGQNDTSSTKSSKESDSEGQSQWDPNIPVPPDGGWGWVVVFASFMIHVIADGIVYSFGIFYSEFLHYFESGKGDTAWIASLMVGITFVSGEWWSLPVSTKTGSL